MSENKIQLPPFRGLDDFLWGSARYRLPNYKSLEKWGHRVVQNLLFYQTNYIVLGCVLFLAMTIFHPVQMVMGALSMIVMYLLFYFVVNTNRSAAEFSSRHPLLGITLCVAGAGFVVYHLGSLLIFLVGILLMISATFVHASLRVRNLKNKVWNLETSAFLKVTPIGIVLDSLGMNVEIENILK